MILICAPFSPKTSLIYSTSDPFLTKDAAMKSTFYFNPNSTKSTSSFSVRVGRLTIAPGKFIFFFSPNLAEFWHYTIMKLSCTSVTLQVSDPSAI